MIELTVNFVFKFLHILGLMLGTAAGFGAMVVARQARRANGPSPELAAASGFLDARAFGHHASVAERAGAVAVPLRFHRSRCGLFAEAGDGAGAARRHPRHQPRQRTRCEDRHAATRLAAEARHDHAGADADRDDARRVGVYIGTEHQPKRAMLALPLTCLPASSPRKRGEERLAATLTSPSPRLRGEGKGEGLCRSDVCCSNPRSSRSPQPDRSPRGCGREAPAGWPSPPRPHRSREPLQRMNQRVHAVR